jgi:hypothetical protein
MALLGWLWLASPFAVIALIAHDPQLRALVGTHHRRCQAAGWSGAAMMIFGAALIPGTLGSMMFLSSPIDAVDRCASARAIRALIACGRDFSPPPAQA